MKNFKGQIVDLVRLPVEFCEDKDVEGLSW
jgi:hypothetical protein